MTDDYEFFRLRKEGKAYVSKLFTWNDRDEVGKRNVSMVIDGSDVVHLGEIEGALCLRLSGEKRRTQVTALVTQDDSGIRKVTLETFKDFGGEVIVGQEKEAFSFREGEFERLTQFLEQIKFINFDNKQKFQIEDLSVRDGPKIVVDAEHRNLIGQIQSLSPEDRATLFSGFRSELTSEEVNIILGRRDGLSEFRAQLRENIWRERDWQNFFEREDWVFGYGLDYRISRPFDREMTVGAGGSDNRDKPIVDFLRTFTDYTVLVEIKRPDLKIFKERRVRAGTRSFSSDFIEAVSQILEQKAEWLSFAQSGNHHTRDGSKRLEARTRNAKTVLVFGSRKEFDAIGNDRDRAVALDTFELFRREQASIDILTFDELYDRARFIVER